MMRRMLALAVVMASSILAAGPEDEVKAADLKWAAAVKAADLASLEKIYTPELIYAHSSGAVEDKATYIGRLKSGKQKYTGVDIEKTRVVLYGDSAVTHSYVRTQGTNDKGSFNDHVMMLHLWVKRGGAWMLAAHQTTKIP
ncbi:MAG: nuclear transport factor 2 family protein [Bryobacteraceae bacterium]|nr:nuclear transport factor 2 family protein [Bryobacteraceae bacterium]